MPTLSHLGEAEKKAKGGDGEGDGEGGAEGDGEGGAEGGAEGSSEGGEKRPHAFIDRYAGPPGTTVTIQAAPQPPFGIPGLPPVPGPSISIHNPGEGLRPELGINFPTPPALHLLQHILQRREEEREAEREVAKEEGEEAEKRAEEGGAQGNGPEPPKPSMSKLHP